MIKITLKFIKNEVFKGCFNEINLRKKKFFAAVIIQMKIEFCLTNIAIAKL